MADESDERVEAYRRGLKGVRGWFSEEDFDAFVAVARAQREHSVSGDILEIGCFEGKSAVLLGFLAGQAETLTVCDLFEDLERSDDQTSRVFYEGVSRSRFEETYAAFHGRLPHIEAGPSSDLWAKFESPRFRIVHVDGSHVYDTVRGDLAFAAGVCVAGGVVVADDYRSRHTPGVAAAFWELGAEEMLRPVLLTPNKAYAAADRLGVEIVGRAVEHLKARDHEVRGEVIRGKTVWWLTPRPPQPQPPAASWHRAIRNWTPPALLRIARRLVRSRRAPQAE